MITLEEIRSHLEEYTLVRDIDRVPRGHIRLETGFLYPDGASVDVFLLERSDLAKRLVLTDLGQTSSWLLGVQVRPWLSRKRREFLDDAIRLYGVRQEGGSLELPLDALEKLADGVARLGQACVRVADLTYTRRSSLQTVFNEEVEEVIADGELQYQPDVDLPGKYGKTVRVDYIVTGKRSHSGILTWASANPSAAHTQANEILRRWFDLDFPGSLEQRVTIFDDRVTAYREDDIKRLEDLSYLYPFSNRQAIVDLLAA